MVLRAVSTSSSSGAVTSVTGTANQITVTGTTTPVLSLPSGIITPGALQVTGTSDVANAAGGALLNEAATSTNPTVVPNKADDNTGIGWVSSDVGSLVANGTEAARWGATGMTLITPALGTPASGVLTNCTGIIKAIELIIDGGGSAITTGVKAYLEVPFACTINRVTMLADQSGSIVVDIWKDTYANYPPLVGDTITASAKPTITTATKSQDSTLTGWTTSVAAGDILAFNVDSITTCTRVTISLRATTA